MREDTASPPGADEHRRRGRLGKTWLAEPDGANRATSLSMAEPVRRRVGWVQRMAAHMTELCATSSTRASWPSLPPTVTIPVIGGSDGKQEVTVSLPVTVRGPEVAASDSDVTAGVLVQLSQSMVASWPQGLSTGCPKLATKKAWEQFVGIPYTADLDQPDGLVRTTSRG